VGISGTLLGGLLIYYSGSSLLQQSCLLGLSGGIMTAVVLFDLWPEALHYGSLLTTTVGTLLGFSLIIRFEAVMKLVPWFRKRNYSRIVKLGLLLGVGIGSHNFPEGVALGTTYAVSRHVREWIGLAFLMAAHNIPEGMVMASAFKIGKVRFGKIVLSLIAVEIPMALGGGVGAFLGKISGEMVALSLGFAGGAMLLLVGKELLPLAKELAGGLWVGIGFGIGILLGSVLIGLI
ncbi:MAG TPA: hypothetical protein VEC37_16520, partial [Bacillota bacterium]|nr:hypothetical protein [Bacillota bacterium]